MKIIEVVNYVIPLYGNNRSLPYGKLLIENDGIRKICDIKRENGWKPYITFNRRRHYLRQVGSLYSPKYVFENE